MGRGTTAGLRAPGAAFALALTLILALALALLAGAGSADAKGGKSGLKPPKKVKVTAAAKKSLKIKWKDTSRGERYSEIKVTPGKKSKNRSRPAATRPRRT